MNRFEIGQQFTKRGKAEANRVWAIVDIHATYNTQGSQVKLRYVATAPSAIGGTVTDYDVCDTTVAMGEISKATSHGIGQPMPGPIAKELR